MVRLRILGRAEVTTVAGTPVAAGIQPKLLALLTYLAVSRRYGAPRRDTLLGMFWPELEPASARHALSQALSRLRGELGGEAVNGRYRETIEIAEGALWCDAVAFREAVQRGSHEEALELYRGPLLDGFFLADAPDFERWLEDERRELRELGVRAGIQLTVRARAEQHWAAACLQAERVIRIDPYEERAWRHLIACRDAAGDRAGAIAAFERLKERLHTDLEVTPSPETMDLISTVRGRSESAGSDERAVAVRLPDAPPLAPPRGRRGPRRTHALAAAAALALLATGFVARHLAPPRPAALLDPNLVAVMPFGVSGLDSAFTALGEGMVELLSLKVGVEGVQRAADPRATIHAWRRLLAAPERELPGSWPLDIARRLGAASVVSGSVIGVGDGVVLSATLRSVADGRMRGRAVVSGSRDSAMVLIDRLAAQLLGLAAREPADRIASLTTHSLPALQAYLAGRTAQRAGRFAESLRHFRDALALDSTFALAGMGMLLSSGWGAEAGVAREPAIRAVWTHRHRLSARDSVRVLAVLGRRYPQPTPAREQIDFIEQALQRVPEDAELWFELAEAVFHAGPRVGITDWRERAGAALARTLTFDSAFAPALVHSIELAADARDTTRLRELARAYSRHAPEGTGGPAHEWLVRATVRAVQGVAAPEPPGVLDVLTDGDLRRVITFVVSYGVGLDDADRALALLSDRGATSRERTETARFALLLALARGRSDEAHRSWSALLAQDTAGRAVMLRSALFYALYWDGSRASALQAARELAPLVDAPLPGDSLSRRARFADVCALGLWQLHGGQVREASAARTVLASASPSLDSPSTVRDARVCSAVLAVLLTEAEGRQPDPARIEQLDSVLTELPVIVGLAPQIVRVGNLVSARLWRQTGDHTRALAALQRRGHNTEARMEPAAFLREECHSARRMGRLELADRSCERYRALRSGPGSPAD